MLFIGLFSWWYSTGWLQLMGRVFSKTVAVLDFFSVGLLFKTLFAPYRQISVGSVQGSLGVQLRAWVDLQISRVIGAMIRVSVIAFGLIATTAMLMIAIVALVLWPLLPALPIIVLAAAIGSGQ